MLEALIWDVDGTLAETERDGHRIAYNQAFADEGLDWHWDEATYGRLLSTAGGKERLARWWAERDPGAAVRPSTARAIAHLYALKTAHYVATVDRGTIGLRPGVHRLLVEARAAGLQLAIATTTSPRNVDALLKATLGEAAPGWFAVIGAGDAVPAKKPAPDIYHQVRTALGLRAGQCLALEDSAIGAQAAVAAGLAVLVTRSHYTRDETLPPVLADLDGLGTPERPARGWVPGDDGARPWQGQVDLPSLRRWCAAWAGLPAVV
ncbi:MAG: hypothetical protein RIQ53_3283 [Pseudomonadota bacterium]|jgi:beta-phosphoglucomutase-like phosphatase (HAD superfamily)